MFLTSPSLSDQFLKKIFDLDKKNLWDIRGKIIWKKYGKMAKNWEKQFLISKIDFKISNRTSSSFLEAKQAS